MELISPGSAVKIGGDVAGIVLQLSIDQQHAVQYQVVWWDGRTRSTAWLRVCEVEPSIGDGISTTTIGFKNR